MKKKRTVILVLAMAPGMLAFALLLPPPAVRRAASKDSILAGAHLDARVLQIVDRSCINCHSLKTEWPIYSRIFPLSRLVESDVEEARSHMNLSRWQDYSDSDKGRILSEIGSVARKHIMPPARYTLIHPSAKLSDEEANELYRWTKTERRWLTQSPGE